MGEGGCVVEIFGRSSTAPSGVLRLKQTHALGIITTEGKTQVVTQTAMLLRMEQPGNKSNH